MYGYIYKTTNLINNKIYIGQKKSNFFVPSYFGSGTIIKRAVDKYGIDNFKIEIVQWCKNREELNNAEIYWIKTLKSQFGFGNGYNICDGGYFSDSFTHNPNKEAIRLKMSIANTGRKHTDEWKKKASKRVSGKGNPMHGVTSPAKGKVMSDKQKRKISESNKNKKFTKEEKELRTKRHKETVRNRSKKKKEEVSKNCSKAAKERLKNNPHPQNKTVYVYEDNVLVNEFINKKECKDYYNKHFNLPSKTIDHNIVYNKPILPDNTRGIRKDLLEIRRKFKNYDFTYIKR